jgi:acyl-coenzyme A synthetase/AMP-(fatty) acid ligase
MIWKARITRAIPDCRGAAAFPRDDYSISIVAEEEVKKLIHDAFSSYATPRRIEAVSELPLTTRGKLDYNQIEQIDSTSVVGSSSV